MAAGAPLVRKDFAMRAVRLSLGIALLAVLVVPTSSPVAQVSSYSSCIQVQNLEGQLATIVITFYARAGGTPTTVNDTINANSSKTYCPLPIAAGFDGSAVVASDRMLAAVVNIYFMGGNGTYDSYAGIQSGSPIVLLPLLMKANYGFNTLISVQNTGTMTTTVTATYSDGVVVTCPVEPGRNCIFDQATEPHANGWVGAATLTPSGGQTIAAIVLEAGPRTLLIYGGFASGSLMPVMPLVQENNYGFITGIQIYNSSVMTDTVVTVDYVPGSAGTACSETQTVPYGQSRTFALQAFSAGGACGAQTFVGAARVSDNSARQPLTAVVNQLNPATGQGSAYGALDPAHASSTVVFPLIMDRNYGWFTGFSVMNVGFQTTNVTCTFTNSSRTVSSTIDPGEAFSDVQLYQLGNNYVGAATCTATGGDRKIVGIANEVGPGGGDTLLTYVGTNIPDP
jgi:hypothetical protein